MEATDLPVVIDNGYDFDHYEPTCNCAVCANHGWRQIETAPKDGTTVLVADTIDGSISLACCLSGGWYLAGDDDYAISTPTHWQPLPLPPETP
jgi:hypothetical protein